MKVIVCQEEPVGGAPSREELIEYWKEKLAEIPQITSVDFHGNFNAAEMEEIAGDYDVLLGAWIINDKFDRDFFDRHPNLKYVSTSGHGFGTFDREAAREKGITFTNTIYGNMTIAQYAMALLLNICHHVDREDAYYRDRLNKGTTEKDRREFAATCTRQIELYEKTIGIIGLGAIGLCMARMAAGFGMKVIAYSRHKKEGSAYDFIEQVSMDELLERSDVISIHCPLTEQTRNLIDADKFAKMKDGVIIINTARGAVIEEEALVEAIKSGKVYAAGLDVVAGEPLTRPTPIFELDRTSITSHIAWAPAEARYRVVRLTVENLKNWLAGTPTSVI